MAKNNLGDLLNEEASLTGFRDALRDLGGSSMSFEGNISVVPCSGGSFTAPRLSGYFSVGVEPSEGISEREGRDKVPEGYKQYNFELSDQNSYAGLGLIMSLEQIEGAVIGTDPESKRLYIELETHEAAGHHGAKLRIDPSIII